MTKFHKLPYQPWKFHPQCERTKPPRRNPIENRTFLGNFFRWMDGNFAIFRTISCLQVHPLPLSVFQLPRLRLSWRILQRTMKIIDEWRAGARHIIIITKYNHEGGRQRWHGRRFRQVRQNENINRGLSPQIAFGRPTLLPHPVPVNGPLWINFQVTGLLNSGCKLKDRDRRWAMVLGDCGSGTMNQGRSSYLFPTELYC